VLACGQMGGLGSGRDKGGGKGLTCNHYEVDVRDCHRKRLLTPGRSFIAQWTRNGTVVFLARARTDSDGIVFSHEQSCLYPNCCERAEYLVLIDWTACNYGGARPWFRCPVVGCDRRVAILYARPFFACRQCCQLAYKTQRVPAYYRAIFRAQAVHMKLGGSGNLSLPLPAKPKGMHRETHFRLCEEAIKWEERSWPRWVLERAKHC
jgi:hypothetical protein